MYQTISEPPRSWGVLKSLLKPFQVYPASTPVSDLLDTAAGLNQIGFFLTDSQNRVTGWVGANQLLEWLSHRESVQLQQLVGELMDSSSAVDINTPLSELMAQLSTGAVTAPAGLVSFCDADSRYLGVIEVMELLRLAEQQVLLLRAASTAAWVKSLLQREALFAVVSIRVAVSSFHSADTSGPGNLEAAWRLVEKTARAYVDPALDHCEFQQAEHQLMLVFRSQDWFERCEALLHSFESPRGSAHPVRIQWAEGTEQHSPEEPIQLSIGAVVVEPGRFGSHHEIMVAAARSVERAQLVGGNVINLDEARFSQSGGRRASVH